MEFDILTGLKTHLPFLNGKPVPRKSRIELNSDIATCPFCKFAEDIENFLRENLDISANPILLTDEFATRELLYLNDDFFLIKNNWPILGNVGGDAYLIILRNHNVDFESLAPTNFINLAQIINYTRKILLYENSIFFLNIGLGSGASLSHLHFQAISAPLSKSKYIRNIELENRRKEDILASRSNNLIISERENAISYIPKYMSSAAEVRIFYSNLSFGLEETSNIIKALNSILGKFNYNVVIHRNINLIEILLVLDYGPIYPRYFDIRLQLVDSQAFAQSLREEYFNL